MLRALPSLTFGGNLSGVEWGWASTCSWCRQGRERPCSKWPSGASTTPRAQPDSPRTHTTRAQHQTKGRPCWLYPTPWIPVCVACLVRRAKAREPRRALGRFTPGAGPGVLTLGQSSCVVSGKSAPTFPISEAPGPPRKAQVLLVPTAAAASFLR